MTLRTLVLPGWHGSGAEHWQTKWERLDANIVRVEQANWASPTWADWSSTLDAQLTEPSVLVAHSLGCLLAARARKNVVAALLVAPPHIDEVPELASFATTSHERLPFPSIVVASVNDPYAELSFARSLADAWGSRFVVAGARGHLNAESMLGTWSDGRSLLRELRAELPFTLDSRLVRDTFVVGETKLNLLLLLNDARYTWFMLVPKRSGIEEQQHLSDGDRATLLEESHALSVAIERAFKPDKINVAALGNGVRQLHMHHVVRTLGDPAWPNPVWGHSPRVPFEDERWRELVKRLFEVEPRFTVLQLSSRSGSRPQP